MPLLKTPVTASDRHILTAFDAGNRPELAANERGEIEVIRSFMPAQMDDAALKDAVTKTIAEVGAASVKDMGKVMAVLKERFAGQMDFSKASGTTKDALSGK